MLAIFCMVPTAPQQLSKAAETDPESILLLQDTEYYWTQDTTEVCFSNNHFWTALLLGVPGVLIVCLGIPAWFAGVLYRGRHDLDNLSLHRTYGFLYQGYK